MRNRKFIALIGFLPLLATGKNICFKEGDPDNGGGGLTPEQEKEIADGLKDIDFTKVVKDNLTTPTTPAATHVKDDTEAAQELQRIMNDDELRPLIEFKSNGGSIATLLKNTGNGVDYDKVDRKSLFNQLVETMNLSDDEKKTEAKRFEGLSPVQQESEVRSYRSELKAKAPAGGGELLKVITDYNTKAAPIKQKETAAVKTYVSLLAQTIKDIKDPEGKDLDPDTADKLFKEATSLSAMKWKKTGDGNVLGTSADDAKTAAKNASLIILGDKILEHTATSFTLLGARAVLAKRFKVNDNSSGGNNNGQRDIGGNKGPVLPKGQTPIVHEKVGTKKQDIHSKT